ncbi:hypothetical protein DB346_11415 [Verrucomicrobia bacterium LW23]|nr:hypothetical protein DB346_11415 [Verrucomicrobia bacterium LW23]
MPRTRSDKVIELKHKLLRRIQEGFFRPGDRFLSIRAITERFEVSYQTAHRLIAELCQEGWIERRPCSGTYIAGQRIKLEGVRLLFHERARREGSFGARLLAQLQARLTEEGIWFETAFAGEREGNGVHHRSTESPLGAGTQATERAKESRPGSAPATAARLYPVMWECREALSLFSAGRATAGIRDEDQSDGSAGMQAVHQREHQGVRHGMQSRGRTSAQERDAGYGPNAAEIAAVAATTQTLPEYALLLHDLGPSGLAGTFVDSISTDDFSGGLCAAEIMRMRGHTSRTAVLAGPRKDYRSIRRVEGFMSLLPESHEVWADGWFLEDGLRAAPLLVSGNHSAIFCCNDRLAEGILRYCAATAQRCPYLIGFDDAPVAEELCLTTIAIPWDEMVESALAVVRKRLRGETSTAARQILAPRPVIRM